MRSYFSLIILSFALAFNASAGSWKKETYADTTVHTFVPSTLEKATSKNRSLMINLHGCAQSAETLKSLAGWEEAAERHKTIVVIPQVPQGVYAGCWNYYGMTHSRKNSDNHFILELTEKWIGDYKVNRNKVFISGLSSGGGLAMVLGCLAPDVYAGIGLNAAPSVGTTALQVGRANIKVDKVIRNCRKISGEKSQYFKTQVASIIYGEDDFVVDPEYSRRNAKALSKIYGALEEQPFDLTKLPGANTKGEGTHFLIKNRPVVSLIQNTGLGHNWPGGQGSGLKTFVSQNSIHYASYLLNFFHSVNRRP